MLSWREIIDLSHSFLLAKRAESLLNEKVVILFIYYIMLFVLKH